MMWYARTMEELKVSQKKVRCSSCSKRLGLVQFPCRCGGVYCSSHRADTLHNCSYDYKNAQQSQLSTVLVKLEGKKLDIL